MKKIGHVAFILGSMLGSELPAAQGVEVKLVDSSEYLDESEPRHRCGKYFVLETRQYGDFEVKQIHVAYEIGTDVATSILYFRDVAVVVDESKASPVLLHKRDNPELEKDTIRLSRAAYEDARDCVPPDEPPDENHRLLPAGFFDELEPS